MKKDVKLESREISKRLENLVDVIPEVVISMKRQHEWLCIEDAYRKTKEFYQISDGQLENCYLLKNSDKINNAIKDNITHVTEESMCDLLEEHLYLKAKLDLEKLLKKIQVHCPDSVIEENESLKLVICNDAPFGYYATSDIVYNEETFKFDFDNVHNLPKRVLDDKKIFEDKENLILNLDKPWNIGNVINELAAEFPEYLEVNEHRGLSTINTEKRYDVISYNGDVGFADWHNGTLTKRNIFRMDNRREVRLDKGTSDEFKQIVRDYFTNKKKTEGLKDSFACEDVTESNSEENSVLSKLGKIIESEMEYMSLDNLISCYNVLSLTNEKESVVTFLENLHIAILDKDGKEKYYNSMANILSENQEIGDYTFYFTKLKDKKLLMSIYMEDCDAKVIENKNDIKSSIASLMKSTFDDNVKYKFISSKEIYNLDTLNNKNEPR